jgi:hypothetical protein
MNTFFSFFAGHVFNSIEKVSLGFSWFNDLQNFHKVDKSRENTVAHILSQKGLGTFRQEWEK